MAEIAYSHKEKPMLHYNNLFIIPVSLTEVGVKDTGV